MHQVWLLLVTLGISATSFGQHSGNRYLDGVIDKTWQRHGGGFLNQESYAHDASKERKLSTTIGSFGTPLASYLGGKYDIPEYSSINIPEVSLIGGEGGLSGMNHKPLKAIESSLHSSMHVNNNGKHYDRDVLIGLARDDDKGLYKGHTEHLPHDVVYREHPTYKEHVSILKQVHPSVKEDDLVEKFKKDPFGQDHYTAMKHNPKGDHVVVDKVVYKGHTEHLPHDILHREHPTDKDHMSIVTHAHPSVQEEYLVEKFKKDPFGQDHYTAMKHNPKGDHIVLDKVVYKGHTEHLPHDLLHREHPTDRDHVSVVTHVHPSVQEEYLVDKLIKDPFSKDHFTVKKHNPNGDHIVVDTIYKDLPKGGHIAVKTQEKIYKDAYTPHEVFQGKDHLTVKTEEIVFKDKGDPPMDRYLNKIHKNVYDPSDDGHHHISVKTEEIYHPKLTSLGKEHLTVKTEEKVYKDIPKSGPDKVTVESTYRTHSIRKPEVYDDPYFGFEKEYSDDKIGFELSDEKILESKQQYRVNEHVNVDVPIEERFSTIRITPTHKISWPRRDSPCEPISHHQDKPECRISVTAL